MAPAKKKSRCSIGSMLDTIVHETENQNNTNADLDEPLSDDNSDDLDTTQSASNDSDTTKSPSDDETEHSADDINDQEIVRRGHAKIGFAWGTGKVMLLELDAENQVIGANARIFSSHLGILAKDGNKLPLSFTDWRAVPSIQKDLVWKEVKDNTNLTDNYKKNCLKKLGKLWKDWKNRLKAKYYTPYRHDKSSLLAKCPERVEADQWPVLVNYWSSNNAKKVSRANRNSRKHVKLPSRMGRKDVASAKEEYRREFGKEPSKVDLFIYSRESKTGKPIDKITEEKIARLKELKNKLPEELTDDIDANDAIFETVIGTEAPGCLRSATAASKKYKNVVFTSREEFDRLVEEKSNDKVASIQKGFEEQMEKFKDEYFSKMEMLQGRLLTLEDQNMNVSGSLSSRRIQALNNGPFSQAMENLDSVPATESLEFTKEMSFLKENDKRLEQLDPEYGQYLKEQEKTKKTSKRKAVKGGRSQ